MTGTEAQRAHSDVSDQGEMSKAPSGLRAPAGRVCVWALPAVCGGTVLRLIRGRPGSFNTRAAAQFLAAAAKPVLGFYDFDPEGLAMAASEPRLEALCLPDRAALQEATLRNRRSHHYLDQVASRRGVLEACRQEPVRSAWQVLKQLQCGLDQEHFPR